MRLIDQLDARMLGHRAAQALGAVAGGAGAGRAVERDQAALAANTGDQRRGDGVADRDVVGADEGQRRAVHAVDEDRHRDAGRGEAFEVLAHGLIVGRVEHHAGHAGPQRLCNQRLLLADVVGRLRHVVDRPGAGLGGHPVGGGAGGVIGRIQAVFGENSDCGRGHGPYFRASAAL